MIDQSHLRHRLDVADVVYAEALQLADDGVDDVENLDLKTRELAIQICKRMAQRSLRRERKTRRHDVDVDPVSAIWVAAVWSAKKAGIMTGPSTAQDTWCASTNDCWVVGEDSSQNTLFQHWDGTTWSSAPYTAANGALQSVWGFASNDVWAVGAFNTGTDPILVHWNGTEWGTTYFVADSRQMAAVLGTASNDVWAVGANGRVAHWNGSGWTGSALGDAINCSDVYGFSSKDVWIAAGSTMLHWDGASWTSTQAAGMNADMRGLWGPALQ